MIIIIIFFKKIRSSISCVAAKTSTFLYLRLFSISDDAAIRSTVFVPRRTSSTKQSTGLLSSLSTASSIRFNDFISTR